MEVRPLSSAHAERVTEFEDICMYLVPLYFAPGMDRDDPLQEARIGVLKGLRDYRPGQGSSLRTFVSMCAERQVQSAVKMATVGKHRLLNTAVSLDAPAPGEDGGSSWHEAITEHRADVVDLVAVRERLHEIGTLFRERLSDLELAALVGVLNDETYEGIAAQLGVSAKAVDSALLRARTKLSGARPEHYRAFGYTCPSCGGATVKRPGRGRPPRCVVCRVRAARAA
jgi:RNA polymerase sporulation-specific sigma factor